jgi:hypothetical protein
LIKSERDQISESIQKLLINNHHKRFSDLYKYKWFVLNFITFICFSYILKKNLKKCVFELQQKLFLISIIHSFLKISWIHIASSSAFFTLLFYLLIHIFFTFIYLGNHFRVLDSVIYCMFFSVECKTKNLAVLLVNKKVPYLTCLTNWKMWNFL